MYETLLKKHLDQRYSNLAREIHFPAELSSNPDQKLQTLQESGSREPDSDL